MNVAVIFQILGGMLSILINSATDSRDKTAKYSHAQAATDSHPKPAT